MAGKIKNGNGLGMNKQKELQRALTHPDCRLEHDSRHNAVYTWGINVLLLIKRGSVVVVLDSLDFIRKTLINYIKSGYIFKKKKCGTVVAQDCDGNKTELVNIILANYFHLPLQALRYGRIQYADGDKLNLTLENISSSSVPCSYTVNRAIRKGYKKILISLQGEKPSYTDYSDAMWNIVHMPIWSWRRRKNDHRLKAVPNVTIRKAGLNEVSLYQIRWAVEHYGLKDDYFSVVDSLSKMRKYTTTKKLCIDHLDGNVKNNCIWNLNCLPIGENTIKGSVSKIFSPFYFFAVHTVDGYRVLCGKDNISHLYFCPKSVDFLNLLKRFHDRGVGGEEAPSDIKEGQRIGYDEDGELTAEGDRAIDYLLSADDSVFELYRGIGKPFSRTKNKISD